MVLTFGDPSGPTVEFTVIFAGVTLGPLDDERLVADLVHDYERTRPYAELLVQGASAAADGQIPRLRTRPAARRP